ncbi:NAC domain-containing protein 83-like [Musa acuminata AAA Group]|uniref:NAC domain-containing protein 83-like n=1 Tax=Musa acuminata AAA Group TaxID=214697 RepID=UPI0031D18268
MSHKPSLVRFGALRLPPGFRFHPTDEDLVVQYLKRKVFSCPLPASIIPEIDLGKYDPWNLPGALMEGDERYCFNRREAKYPNGKRSNRAARSGYWKARGKDKQIVASGCNQVVGMRRVLVFYRGKPPTSSPTDWMMHEYRLAGSDGRSLIYPQRKNSTHGLMIPSQDWVLCRIFKRRRAPIVVDEEEDIITNDVTDFSDFMDEREGDPTPSSSSSPEKSCVTELFDESSRGEETNSPP